MCDLKRPIDQLQLSPSFGSAERPYWTQTKNCFFNLQFIIIKRWAVSSARQRISSPTMESKTVWRDHCTLSSVEAIAKGKHSLCEESRLRARRQEIFAEGEETIRELVNYAIWNPFSISITIFNYTVHAIPINSTLRSRKWDPNHVISIARQSSRRWRRHSSGGSSRINCVWLLTLGARCVFDESARGANESEKRLSITLCNQTSARRDRRNIFRHKFLFSRLFVSSSNGSRAYFFCEFLSLVFVYCSPIAERCSRGGVCEASKQTNLHLIYVTHNYKYV